MPSDRMPTSHSNGLPLHVLTMDGIHTKPSGAEVIANITIATVKGEQKSPEYLKINPCATVPAAVDGDLHITESNVIMRESCSLPFHPLRHD